MAIRSGFFNSINGDRKYGAERFAEYFASFIGNGVFPNPSNGLQVMANNDMTVTVKAGRAWINGYILINDDDYTLTLEPADGVLSRIDRIVVRYDIADREIRLEVKKGTFASSPVAPTLQRDADAYELALADIYISAGTTSITQANITDLRLSTEYCGIVHGVVDQVDTEVLFQDYQAWIAQKKQQYDTDISQWTQQKQEEFQNWYTAKQQEMYDVQAQLEQAWNAWFQTIQNALDGDTAGNLYNEIQDVRKDIGKRNLPNNADHYNSVAQWSDILIPDEARGKALLEFLLMYEGSSEQIATSEQAMLVIMEEERFNKDRQIPFDYTQIIQKLGVDTEVGQYLQWVEELLADHTRGIEKLELGMMLEAGSNEITSNEYAMKVIMAGEELDGLTNYRKKFAVKNDMDAEITRLDNEIVRIEEEITNLDNRISDLE